MKRSFSLLKSLSCTLTSHNYEVSHVVSDRVKEYNCTHCNKEMTTDIYGNLVPLSDLQERINKVLNDLAIKKNRKQVAA